MDKTNYPGFRWLVLVTMFIVTAIASIFLIAPAALIGEMMKAMPGASPGKITFITMSVFNIVVIVSAILGGPLLDKFGIMKVYIGGLILLALGALLTPFIDLSFEGMIFIRILQGAGTGPIMVSVVPVAAKYLPIKLRSTLIVLQGFAVSSGIWIGMLLISRIFQATQNWQTSLAWLAPICIIGMIFSFIAVLSERRSEEELSGIKNPFKEDLKPVILKPDTWVVVGCLAIISWMYQSFNNLATGYLSAAPPAGLGYDPAVVGVLSSWAWIVLVLGGIVGVLITEMFLQGNARPVVLAGFVLGAIFIYLVGTPAVTSKHMILEISFYASGFFSACISPLALGYIAKYYPRHITGAIGGIAIGISAIAGLAGVTVGDIAVKNSGYHMSFNILVVVALTGAVIAHFLKPVKEV